jgi:hypothetical protein
VIVTPWLPGLVGALIVVVILWDAFETVLVPRRIGRRVRLTRYFYLISWRGWRALALAIRKPSRRESLLAFFGPISLILLLACWAFGLIAAFALLQIAALGSVPVSLRELVTMLYLSGETFFTLGFGDITPGTAIGRALSVGEAGMGFGFLGTVVGYLPTMYTAFSQREIEISLLDARAGSPPSAAEFLVRRTTHGETEWGDEVMREWERWAAQLPETHISYPQLAYYRSQHSNQSWLGALTAILDASAIQVAAHDGPGARQAHLTFAMARHALVDITQIFVRRRPPGAPDRLTPERLKVLRARLADGPARLPDAPEFEARLAALRRLYEPYAQALARYLVFELPPWILADPRRDNWRGGPWDRELSTRADATYLNDEHF